jgi:hypothetical protein
VLKALAAQPPIPAFNNPPEVITEPFTIMLFGITSEAIQRWLGAGKKGGHVADAPLYCFAHGSKSHNGDACKDLEKLIAESPAYKFVSKLKANKAKDTITVKLPAQELKLKAGFLRYKGKDKNPAPAAPRPANNPRQRAPAAAASVATDADTDIQDDLSTLGGSGWGTADGSDA